MKSGELETYYIADVEDIDRLKEGDIYFLALGTSGIGAPVEWGRALYSEAFQSKEEIKELCKRNMIRIPISLLK